MSCFSVYVAIKQFKSNANTEMVLIQCCQWPEFKTIFVQVTRYFLIFFCGVFLWKKNPPQPYLDLFCYLLSFLDINKIKGKRLKYSTLSVPFFSVEESILFYKYI